MVLANLYASIPGHSPLNSHSFPVSEEIDDITGHAQVQIEELDTTSYHYYNNYYFCSVIQFKPNNYEDEHLV